LTSPTAKAAELAASLRFYHPDHLGSINLVTDGAGNVVEATEHAPFGAVHRREENPGSSATLPPGHLATRPGFTGQREDARNGLVLFPARAYDPEIGRFTQPDPFVQDPADPQSLNRYSYVRNNPVNLVDPTGYSFWSKFFGAVAAVVVGVATAGLGSGLSLAIAAGTFGAVDGGVSAAQAGAGASGIFKSAAIGFTAGFVGGAVGGAVAGTVGGLSSSYVGGFVGGAAGGAAAGATGAALGGGSIGRSAAAGAAAGAVFGAYSGISVPGAMLASAVVGAVVAGEDPVDALVEGAGTFAGFSVGGYAAGYVSGHTTPGDGQLERFGVQKGDPIYYLGRPGTLAKFLVGLLDGPFSHVNIYDGNGRVADNSWGRRAGIRPLTDDQFQGRRFVSFRGAPGAANLNYNALSADYAKAHGQYNPATLNVCSTFCTAVYGAGNVQYPNGIGPNAQFINQLIQQ